MFANWIRAQSCNNEPDCETNGFVSYSGLVFTDTGPNNGYKFTGTYYAGNVNVELTLAFNENEQLLFEKLSNFRETRLKIFAEYINDVQASIGYDPVIEKAEALNDFLKGTDNCNFRPQTPFSYFNGPVSELDIAMNNISQQLAGDVDDITLSLKNITIISPYASAVIEILRNHDTLDVQYPNGGVLRFNVTADGFHVDTGRSWLGEGFLYASRNGQEFLPVPRDMSLNTVITSSAALPNIYLYTGKQTGTNNECLMREFVDAMHGLGESVVDDILDGFAASVQSCEEESHTLSTGVSYTYVRDRIVQTFEQNGIIYGRVVTVTRLVERPQGATSVFGPC